MNYKVFCKRNSRSTNIFNIVISLLVIIGIFISVILLSVDLFKKFTVIAIILMVIKIILEKKNVMFRDKEANKVLKLPLVLDNENNIFIINNKLNSKLAMIFVVIASFLFFMIIVMFRLNGDLLYYFIFMLLVVLGEIGEFTRIRNEKYLKNNINNLEVIINSKNLKFDVMRVVTVSKNENNLYILGFENGVSIKVFISKEYENYDSLINLLNQKSSKEI